jgi:putative membrane protein
MKSIFKKILLNIVAIFLVSTAFSGLSYGNDLETLVLAGVTFAFANAFIRPFLKILLLPINIITLGLTGWLVNTIILFLVSVIIPGFQVVAFQFELLGTTVVLSQFFSFIFISIILSLVTSLINWIID